MEPESLERVRHRVVDPDGAEARVVADVLQQDHTAIGGGGYGVEHAMTFVPAQLHADGSAGSRIIGVVELEPPQPRITAERRGGVEIEPVRMRRVPGAVLRPHELADARAFALRLDLRAGQSLRIRYQHHRESGLVAGK